MPGRVKSVKSQGFVLGREMGYKRPMPSKRYFCPKCGRAGFIAGRSCHCPACGFIYFHNVAAAVAVILEVGEQIVLTRRARAPQRGWLDLPGGFIEPGETAEQGLRRELLEELNLKPADLKYLCSVPNRYPYAGVEYRTLDLFFVARLASLEGLRMSDEILTIQTALPTAVDLNALAFESIRQGFAQYLGSLPKSG